MSAGPRVLLFSLSARETVGLTRYSPVPAACCSRSSSKHGAPSKAASPAGRSSRSSRRRRSRRRRRAVATAADAPTRPPRRKSNALPPFRSVSMGRLCRAHREHSETLLLDVIVRLEEPLAPGGDVRAATRAGAGGQAANVAAWAAELGAEASCIAKRGDDPAGELVARELAAHGVELLGPVAHGSTGVVVSIVETGDRALASDRGVGDDVRARGARRGVARVRRPPRLRLRARTGADRRDRRSSPRGSHARRARASRSTSPRGPRSGALGRSGSASSSTSSRRMSSSRPRRSGNFWAARTSTPRRAC